MQDDLKIIKVKSAETSDMPALAALLAKTFASSMEECPPEWEKFDPSKARKK